MEEQEATPPAAAADDGPETSIDLPRGAGTTVALVVAAIIVLYLILAVVVWQAGVFEKETSASDTRVVVGMLTLLGGLLASAFTLVGLLLKHSIDQHSVRLAQEAERNRRLEMREAEARLRLETSIKAVELLTTNGCPAPSAQQAGALFVLASQPLQQLDLAVALLNEQWATGNISPSAGVWVIDQALKHDDSALQQEAASTLLKHAGLLAGQDGTTIAWPGCASFQWPTATSYFARDRLVDAFVEIILQRAADQWPGEMVHSFIVQLNVIRTAEERAEIKATATLVLDILLVWVLRHGEASLIMLPDGKLDLAALRLDIAADLPAARAAATTSIESVLGRLRATWNPAD